jgi:hypothetical protein
MTPLPIILQWFGKRLLVFLKYCLKMKESGCYIEKSFA